jgi:hypothetical protein
MDSGFRRNDDRKTCEEPQAAFYAWIDAVGDRWRDQVQKGDLVLVCDVGGGTSDFSLIRVSEADGQLELERIAVGEHLLVGGDNMDLALAYAVARRLAEKGTRLDAWQMRGLWHACRRAKERLLSGEDAAVYPLTILGRGSKLIGGTPVEFRFLSSSSRRDDVVGAVLDGWEDEELDELAPMATTLEWEGHEGATVPIHLQARVTELGVLELWCVSRDDDKRWKLELNVRAEKSA